MPPRSSFSKKKILIIGATSAIAEAVANLFTEELCEFYLLARNQKKLKNIAETLKKKGAEFVETFRFDALNLKELEKSLETIFQKTEIDIVLIAHSLLPNQKLSQENFSMQKEALEINGISTIFLLNFLTKKAKKEMIIVTITSLVVENIRKSNYIYATSKAIATSYLEGLRHRFQDSKVHLIDIRPALVKTTMTTHLNKKLTITAEKVAQAIKKAILKKKKVVYIPFYWKWILLIIKNLPEKTSHLIYKFFSRWNKKGTDS